MTLTNEKKKTLKRDFWYGKRVFITGNTGFKGSWLTIWLLYLGANVIGFSKSKEDNFFFKKIKLKKNFKFIKGDVYNADKLKKSIIESKAEIIFHLAAQPIFNLSFSKPIETLNTNLNGTINILDIAKDIKKLKSLVIITSDKVYKNDENNKLKLSENSHLGGNDIYSVSKSCADLISNSYYKSFYENQGKGIATVRAGNVIGGGDWQKDRLFPDIFKSIFLKKKLIIRNLNHSRPWHNIMDCISDYLLIAENLHRKPKLYSTAWNIGPKVNQKKILVGDILKKLSKKNIKIEYELKKINKFNEKKFINLNTKKFQNKFKWKKDLSFNLSLDWTLDWYENEFNGMSTYDNTLEQIKKYEKLILKI